ncbi:MAG: metallophosphoesterase, partial [Rickettsiales bacterium]|nr:metallophosphoesterase [Rickettsiales bacterium]
MSDRAKYNYKRYKKKFIDQYEDEIARFIEFSKKDEMGNSLNTKDTIENNLGETLDIIWSSRKIKPRDDIADDDIFFETDLHGDMRAFLNTLCETGAVEYKDDEEALIFYNPEVDVDWGEKETYTLNELEFLKVSNFEEHRKLMRKLQPLANVVPTDSYSHYINCGDFMDRGKQSEQMIHLINYLSRQCEEEDIEPAKLIMGNHELFYLDSSSRSYLFNKGCCICGYLDTIEEESQMYLEKTTSLEKAVQEAVANKALVLAHSEGATLFSHVVITKDMVYGLAKALKQLAKEREKLTNSEPTADEIYELADKFKELDTKIEDCEPFDENDAKDLADGLNEFLSMRPEIFKDFAVTSGIGLNCSENCTKAEKKLFKL